MEPNVVLCDIITNELGIDPARVVIYNQNWEPPNDVNIYVTVATENTRVIGSANKFDPDTDEEVKTVVMQSVYNIEVVSKNQEAPEKKEEIIMSLNSTYGLQKQEENEFSLFRSGDILDLSFIEGASALNRYRIPVRIIYKKIKRSLIPSTSIYYKERAVEVITDE